MSSSWEQGGFGKGSSKGSGLWQTSSKSQQSQVYFTEKGAQQLYLHLQSQEGLAESQADTPPKQPWGFLMQFYPLTQNPHQKSPCIVSKWLMDVLVTSLFL